MLTKANFQGIFLYSSVLIPQIKIITVSKCYVPVHTLVTRIAVVIAGWNCKFFIVWESDCMTLRVFYDSESCEIAFKT